MHRYLRPGAAPRRGTLLSYQPNAVFLRFDFGQGQDVQTETASEEVILKCNYRCISPESTSNTRPSEFEVSKASAGSFISDIRSSPRTYPGRRNKSAVIAGCEANQQRAQRTKITEFSKGLRLIVHSLYPFHNLHIYCTTPERNK